MSNSGAGHGIIAPAVIDRQHARAISPSLYATVLQFQELLTTLE
jgi:hypothetical protein